MFMYPPDTELSQKTMFYADTNGKNFSAALFYGVEWDLLLFSIFHSKKFFYFP